MSYTYQQHQVYVSIDDECCQNLQKTCHAFHKDGEDHTSLTPSELRCFNAICKKSHDSFLFSCLFFLFTLQLFKEPAATLRPHYLEKQQQGGPLGANCEDFVLTVGNVGFMLVQNSYTVLQIQSFQSKRNSSACFRWNCSTDI